MKRALLTAVIGAMLLQPGAAPVGADAPPLDHFKNYFVTGDYVVGGTSLWRKGVGGKARELIEISGVPPGADIVAAYLYVQTAELVQWSGIDRATFGGADLGPGATSVAKALTWDAATRPCWSVNWGGGRRLVTYRADVLRFLPIGEDGKTNANGVHQVEVPDVGVAFPDSDEGDIEKGGHAGPRAVGASLVVVYSDSTEPLRGIVIRDGAVTKNAFGSVTLPIAGFYQASSQPAARLTALVGDGRPFLSERVRVNNQLIATNPFVGSAGPKWDNATFENVPVAPGSSSAVVQITANGLLSDCVSVSALVFSTEVQDSDGDGLLDIWESSTAPILDPLGRPLPNLRAMGSDPGQKDLFVEINYMFTDGAQAYGGVQKPAHSHLPSHAALARVGDAFANAPTGRINVHFDLGDSYPPGEADQYIIRGAGLARGGEAINELSTVCTPGAGDPPDVCQFSGFPGTVGWKTGFQFLRDAVLSGPPLLPNGDDPCDAPGAACVRRFDPQRKDMFRYALFTHAIGLPKSDVAGHPDFNVPRTNTGVGDFPGGDFIVSLGAFDDADGLPVGTPFMQASTMMHELGHGFERRHGGDALEPNCKPLYLSVMNYLYQLRGLLDDRGTPHLDFSRNDFTGIAIDETALFDGSLSLLPYRIGYYAPLVPSYLGTLGSPVTKHCDGSPLLPTDPAMVRIDARTAAGAIDWKADGTPETTPFTQDVNFNGRTLTPDLAPEVLAGSDDWARIVLNQTGGRRSAGGLFVDASGRYAVGPLSLDAGRGDLGRGDLGRGDLGRGDLGRGDLGRGDLGRGDLGRGDLGTVLGRGDLGRGDLGGGDLFVGGPGEPGGELDFETAVSLAKTPPNEFRACVIGEDCPEGEVPLHKIRLDWTSPTVGAIAQYEVLRVAGAELTPESMALAVVVGHLAAIPGQVDYALIDQSALANGQSYTYFARATYTDGTLSDPSNIVTIVAVNDPPVAVDDSYSTDEDTALDVPAPGVLANDTDEDGGSTMEAVLVSGPSHGTLAFNADGSFVYTPAANYNGADSFTYRVRDGAAESLVATVTLTVVAVNDAPSISNIPNQAIDVNTSTGPVAFVIGDDDLSGVILVGTSSNTALVPDANIVFGGSGPNRTATVTPAANQTGTTTITVTVVDGGGLTVSDTFVLTVKGGFAFKNVKNAPPPSGTRIEGGSVVPMTWGFTNGSKLVESKSVVHVVTISGPLPAGPTWTIADTGGNKSPFKYSAPQKTWSFNLKMTDERGRKLPAGLYKVTITPTTPGFEPSPTFELLVK